MPYLSISRSSTGITEKWDVYSETWDLSTGNFGDEMESVSLNPVALVVTTVPSSGSFTEVPQGAYVGTPWGGLVAHDWDSVVSAYWEDWH